MDAWMSGAIPCTDLEYWASLGNLDEVRKALERNPDANIRGVGSYTAMHAAAENGHLQVLRYLVVHGGNINVRLDSGETPLKLAEIAAQIETVAWLKSLGSE